MSNFNCLVGRRVDVCRVVAAAALFVLMIQPASAGEAAPDVDSAIKLVVMDPLAKPLSCPCVEGYAQRDYDQLGARLAKELGRPVEVIYNESLATALKGDAAGQAHLIIGKHSVVEFDAARTGLAVNCVGSLTGKDGQTTMTGLVVVPNNDPAQSIADLGGYRVVFGPEECDEKHAAALTLLKQHGVAAPAKLETSPACSDGAIAILEDAEKGLHGAAVISSYAAPLLEGCGTVEKGALRVVGETAAVPFIEAFTSDQLSAEEQAAVAAALLKATSDPALRLALETRDGFVAVDESAAEAAKKK